MTVHQCRQHALRVAQVGHAYLMTREEKTGERERGTEANEGEKREGRERGSERESEREMKGREKEGTNR